MSILAAASYPSLMAAWTVFFVTAFVASLFSLLLWIDSDAPAWVRTAVFFAVWAVVGVATIIVYNAMWVDWCRQGNCVG